MTGTIREATTHDRTAVMALCQATLDPADTADRAGLERLLWRTEGMLRLVAETEGRLSGVAFGTVGTEANGQLSGAVTLIAVDASRRRTGVGGGLLARLEAGLRQLGAVDAWSGGGQPRFWWPGIPASDSATLELFQRAGYQLDDDTAANMIVALEAADLESRPTGEIVIRRLEAAELPEFQGWMTAAWADPWWGETELVAERDPISCHVAVRDGRYLGFAAYDTNRRGLFGPMGSSPAARGTGLGAALLRRCLRDYRDQGLTECEIGWVGPAEFYTKVVGAQLSRRFLRLRKPL